MSLQRSGNSRQREYTVTPRGSDISLFIRMNFSPQAYSEFLYDEMRREISISLRRVWLLVTLVVGIFLMIKNDLINFTYNMLGKICRPYSET